MNSKALKTPMEQKNGKLKALGRLPSYIEKYKIFTGYDYISLKFAKNELIFMDNMIVCFYNTHKYPHSLLTNHLFSSCEC